MRAMTLSCQSWIVRFRSVEMMGASESPASWTMAEGGPSMDVPGFLDALHQDKPSSWSQAKAFL